MDADQTPPQPHRDQLRQGTYTPYNRVIHGPPGTNVGSLWIEVNADDDNHVVTASSWDLDDRHRAMIDAGGHIRLSMWQYPICPVSVAVEAPFCECHDEEMEFNEHDGGFYCRHLTEVGDERSEHAEPDEGDGFDQARRDFSPAEDDDEESELD